MVTARFWAPGPFSESKIFPICSRPRPRGANYAGNVLSLFWVCVPAVFRFQLFLGSSKSFSLVVLDLGYEQQPFLVVAAAPEGWLSSTRPPTLLLEVAACLLGRCRAIMSNNSATLLDVFALVSMNNALLRSARSAPCLVETARSVWRSHLFPTSTIMTSWSRSFLTSSTHLSTA